MKIVDFNYEHIEKAKEIALVNYERERRSVPVLPKEETVPDLEHFADNRLGVAAFEGEEMLGFLCAYAPREDAFGTTKVKGTFSPIHAHGVVLNDETEGDVTQVHTTKRYNRDRVYSLLYQEAAKKWVKEGIRSHAIGLYAHDKDAINSFYYNGFGLRCIDAIRSLEAIPDPVNIAEPFNTQLKYCELPRNEWGLLLEEHNALISHLGNSPTFMKLDAMDQAGLYQHAGEDVRYFTAKKEGNHIAYIKISNDGENFATEDKKMININGAYCKPEFRGSGIYHNLLCYLMNVLKKEGYLLLGVDCESFNPTARGFWLKYFAEYTHSVVRRIDDKAVL
ncbi:MAG: putative glycosyl hydrolase [Herbinix sp.]|nr:putative glycosyl hydrolase [Herbinix sp.]